MEVSSSVAIAAGITWVAIGLTWLLPRKLRLIKKYGPSTTTDDLIRFTATDKEIRLLRRDTKIFIATGIVCAGYTVFFK